MKLGLLPLLACPDCGGGIKFAELGHDPRMNEELEKGLLACASCGARFPIENHIPKLYPSGGLDFQNRKTKKRFGWEWKRYPGSLDEDRGVFLTETQIPAGEWKDKLCLDAGCGMGRYSRVALDLGAQVVAFDLSDALERLLPRALEDRALHLVQGDLFHPPFKPAAFDVIYSLGVLHHTPDTRTAFGQVAKRVKRDGRLTVWVYGTPGSYASFSGNPLRGDRQWLAPLRPLIWLIVWARQILSDVLRLVTTRLPVPLLYLLCYPLAALGGVPVVKYLTYSVHADFRVRLIENFDWLAPPYQHKHTKEELRGWFAEEGYEVLSQLAHGVVPKVGVLGRKP
ncbi:MAG: methyltransferase domain-containing protein [Elusimicrobia bacterium]|nr:methyltransferase domain-containing protein [Elusimicrobiota bacterium]